jgi:hypothetical protein
MFYPAMSLSPDCKKSSGMISASEQFYEKPAEADMLFVLFFT